MYAGKKWQFCEMQDEGGVLRLSKYQDLMRAAMNQLFYIVCLSLHPEIGAHDWRLCQD